MKNVFIPMLVLHKAFLRLIKEQLFKNTSGLTESQVLERFFREKIKGMDQFLLHVSSE